jgi:hypothetical protein
MSLPEVNPPLDVQKSFLSRCLLAVRRCAIRAAVFAVRN